MSDSNTLLPFFSYSDLVLKWLVAYEDSISFPVLVFVAKKVEAESLASALRAAGLRTTHVHSGVSRRARSRAQDALRAGELDAVVATDCWATGVDIPELRGVLLARGGAAPIGLKQRAGRAVRLADGKLSFTVWDLVAPQDKRTQERIEAYEDGGYDVQLLERLYAPAPKRRQRAQAQTLDVQPRSQPRPHLHACAMPADMHVEPVRTRHATCMSDGALFVWGLTIFILTAFMSALLDTCLVGP